MRFLYALVVLLHAVAARKATPADVDVAAFIYDPWNPDPIWNNHGPNWTEWELVKSALPRFEGHQQPRVPLWGYQDTSKPEAYYMKIKAATDNGISVFLFDWYWFMHYGIALQRGLEQGFLRANNSQLMKFAVMFANQDWRDIQPAKRLMAYQGAPQYSGDVNTTMWHAIVNYWVNNYFKQPNYYLVPDLNNSTDNTTRRCPLVNIYLIDNLVNSLGGLTNATAAMTYLRSQAAGAGFPCVHVQAEDYGLHSFGPSEWNTVIQVLGINSVTAYCWQHNTGMPDFPLTDYDKYAGSSMAYWRTAAGQFDAPYVPNFSVGWDPSPRTIISDAYDNWGYPSTAVVQSTPAQIQTQLTVAADYITGLCDPAWCMMTVYAFNECSEGGCLEPETRFGYGKLNAFQAVFGSRNGSAA